MISSAAIVTTMDILLLQYTLFATNHITASIITVLKSIAMLTYNKFTVLKSIVMLTYNKFTSVECCAFYILIKSIIK